jgi:hypothetical protein
MYILNSSKIVLDTTHVRAWPYSCVTAIPFTIYEYRGTFVMIHHLHFRF